MQIGIVGLPFSGKSTLFQTITKTHLDAASLGKSEVHHAIVKVPDARLENCSRMFNPKSTVHATIEFVDVIGLKKGESGSTQFTTNFLSNVKSNDALIQVVRQFNNEAVPHPDGSIDPMRDVSTFETEFILSDLALLESRIDKVKAQIQKTSDEHSKKELPLLEKCHQLLQSEVPLRESGLIKQDLQTLKTYQLLSIKPMLIAVNMDESCTGKSAELLRPLEQKKGGKNTNLTSFFGKIEMELSELREEEVETFMREYGINESALSTIIREAYKLLGLQSFFTVGEDECRAWTIKRGMTAQEAAGVIHSDFLNKFIRAEVVHYDDLVASGGSFAKAKEAGHWRLEGKEYVVKDGDILTIRHS